MYSTKIRLYYCYPLYLPHNNKRFLDMKQSTLFYNNNNSVSSMYIHSSSSLVAILFINCI